MSLPRRRVLLSASLLIPAPASVFTFSQPLCRRCFSLQRAARLLSMPSARLALSRSRVPPLVGSLVPTSPPLPRIPPSAPAADKPISLRPPHFLKQFFLRVHPDLFHAPFARVQHTALITDDESDSQQQQLSAEPITIVTAGVEEMRVTEVSSALMREVNERSVARLNELMQYYKHLQSFGEHTPLVAALPAPPADSHTHFAFYVKHSADTFTHVKHRFTPAETHTPIIAVHAIDAFLTRLLLSANLALPASLVAQWKADWADRRRSHRYERLKKHMPWMMDSSKRAADTTQETMIRRDYNQVKLHSTPLTHTQRTQHYMAAMHAAGLVQLSEALSEVERVRGARLLAAVVSEYGHQLRVEEWLGSVVKIGSAEEGYGWEMGVLRLPYNMTQQRVWETCREYVEALKKAKAKMEEGGGAVAEEKAEEQGATGGESIASVASVKDREQWLSKEWAEQGVASVSEDDPDWQLTAQEVRERRHQLQQSEHPMAAQSSAVRNPQPEQAVASERSVPVKRRMTVRSPVSARPKMSAAEWARQLDRAGDAWMQS